MSDGTQCTHCAADITNGLTLCARCQQTLRHTLVNVAAYFTDVDRIRPGQRVKVRGAYESTPPPGVQPPRDPIADALNCVAAVVYGWASSLQRDRPDVLGRIPTTTERRCGWLESHVPSIATLDWAAACVRELLDSERTLRRILDRADTGWYAGRCGNELGREVVDGQSVAVTCDRALYGTKGTPWIRCPECGRTWNSEDRRKVMLAEARDKVAPVSTIARAIVGLVHDEVSVKRLANRIDQWVSRGRLDDLGVRVLGDGKPHRVYRLGDVFDLLRYEMPAADDSDVGDRAV